MRNLIIHIYKYLYRLRANLYWWRQFKLIIKHVSKSNYSRCLSPMNLTSLNKTLIIVPHADDDLIGNYSIFKYATNNVYVYHVGNYPIEDDELTYRRNNELRNFCQHFNAQLFNHTSLSHPQDIAKLISENEINSIFTPDFFDWHPDHQKATEYLLDALELLNWKGKIFTYSISVPKPLNKPAFFIPYTKTEQNEKWRLFYRFYPSQKFMPVSRFKFQERINSTGINGAYAGDIYTEMSYTELKKAQRDAPDENLRNMLLRELNNLIKIRQFSDSKR